MDTKIEKARLENVFCEGEFRSFQYPPFKGTYGDVARQIDDNGFNRPHPSYTLAIVRGICDLQRELALAYAKEEMYTSIDLELNDILFEFTGNLYLPKSNEEINNGVILEHNPKILNGKLHMDKNSLVKRLRENDSNVKFVPFGYKTGEMHYNQIRKHPYIIARYGEKEINYFIDSDEVDINYIVNIPNYVEREKSVLSSLIIGEIGDFLQFPLTIEGQASSENIIGHAFGVFP